jgi:hypothetical protein
VLNLNANRITLSPLCSHPVLNLRLGNHGEAECGGEISSATEFQSSTRAGNVLDPTTEAETALVETDLSTQRNG